MTPELTSFQRKYLRGLAHSLKAVILVGQKGVTDLVLRALNEALCHHELVKIKFIEDKAKVEKRSLAETLQRAASAELVGMIGHTAILYRQHPDSQKRKIHLPQYPSTKPAAASKPQ